VPFDLHAFETARDATIERLLQLRGESGHWSGQLSASALSTATASFALHGVGGHEHLVRGGLQWIADHQNDDGGWGDTVNSKSNLSTTALCWAALSIGDAFDAVVRKAEQWLTARAGGLGPEKLIPAIERRYGEDRTFSVPILTMCALAGRLGEDGLQHVRPLPFELAVLPHWTYRWLKLDVVSYALPALIAMGQVRHHALPSRHPIVRFVRNRSQEAALRRLVAIQPAGGGFLEAAPLTSFVVMSIRTFLPVHHPVIRRGTEFLVRSVAPDGSWPIDTNLATWLTTLAVNALASAGRLDQHLTSAERGEILEWLLAQQYRKGHPYTGAAPGGWAWTDLTGGVPDADDTSGALIALANLTASNPEATSAAESGVRWLLDLQNRDGGIPTFCRGWGRFPFDRSSTDITAHAMRAWQAWLPQVSQRTRRRVEKGRAAAYGFLKHRQRDDGSWLPLWFGNQHSREEENPTYGTTRVVAALHEGGFRDHPPCQSAVRWLLDAQAAEGGWSGEPGLPPSIEETALAVEALASADHGQPHVAEAVKKGVQSLIEQTQGGTRFPPVPIGFYFARLWYYEELYPVVFAAAALERASHWLE
jgi:squalene-hopene/tetraprenyl-beta-curcumene cyclase